MATQTYYLDKRTLVSGEPSYQKYDNALNLKEYIEQVVDDSETDFTSINVNTINESTSGHGVIIDGVTIKDGVVTSTGINTYSTTVGITAFAGGGQASATALTTEYNTIGVCATAGDSVKLPTPAVGKLVQVFNGGATDLAVFPVTGGTIGGLSANASITLPPQSVKYFLGVSATAWGLDGRLVAVENGTVTAPSITFDNNSDTGLYYVSATQTGFSTGGTLVGGFNASGLFTDVIAEQTSTAGVTIDGVLCKDGAVSANGGVYVAGFYLSTNGPQSITGPGAINLTSHATQITTTGADAFTLGNGGVNGQLKRITLVVDGGDATVTPTTAYFTTATFNDAGDTALFIYNTVGGWQCIENSGVTIA